MPNTAITTLYGPIRAILGDFNASFQQYENASILAVVQALVLTGQLPGYTLANASADISPALATPRDYGLVIYKSALTFVSPEAASYSFRTRAIGESFGDRKQFITDLHNALYEMDMPAMMASWSSFSTWLTGITGLNVFQHLTDLQVRAPIATAQISQAGLTISGSQQ